MRRLATVLGTATGVLLISSPAYAFAHDKVSNPYLHTTLDVLTLAVVTSPLWTAFLWGARRRLGLLLALIAVVQLPVAAIGFTPIANPAVHIAASLTALALTCGSLWYVHRAPVATPRAAAATPS